MSLSSGRHFEDPDLICQNKMQEHKLHGQINASVNARLCAFDFTVIYIVNIADSFASFITSTSLPSSPQLLQAVLHVLNFKHVSNSVDINGPAHVHFPGLRIKHFASAIPVMSPYKICCHVTLLSA